MTKPSIRQFSACIVAAGAGSRAGGGLPKQFRAIAGKPMIGWAVEAFASHPDCAEIVIAVAAGMETAARAALGEMQRPVRFVTGGETRTASVRAAVQAAEGPLVLVHDAARPFVSRAVIDGVLGALERADGAAPVLPVADALAMGPETLEPRPRDGLVRIQTPQGFARKALLDAFACAPGDYPDETALAAAAGCRVIGSTGEERNFKVTYPEDFERAESLLMTSQTPLATPLPVAGSGFDVHRLIPGEGMHLCGVFIPGEYALEGHSDADAGLHAVTDAVLGACGRGDIGQHFPPTGVRWKGAASDAFLVHALELAREAGVEIVHVDVTIICERPKVGPHREAMRDRICEIMGLAPAWVNVKATTTEKLGFTGRKEGLAAQAVVSGLFRP